MTTTHPTIHHHTLTTSETEAERDAFVRQVQDWKEMQFYEKYNRLSSHVWLTLEEDRGLSQLRTFLDAGDAYDAFQACKMEHIFAGLWITLYTETGVRCHWTLAERELLLANVPSVEEGKKRA